MQMHRFVHMGATLSVPQHWVYHANSWLSHANFRAGLLQSNQISIRCFSFWKNTNKKKSRCSPVRSRQQQTLAAHQWRCCFPGILRWFPCHGNWTPARHPTPIRRDSHARSSRKQTPAFVLLDAPLQVRKKKERPREGSRRRRKRRRVRCVTDIRFQLFCCACRAEQ